MLAKILTTIHGGVAIGSIGEVQDDFGGGYAIRVQMVQRTLFGGKDEAKMVVLYFTKNEVELIPDSGEIEAAPSPLRLGTRLSQKQIMEEGSKAEMDERDLYHTMPWTIHMNKTSWSLRDKDGKSLMCLNKTITNDIILRYILKLVYDDQYRLARLLEPSGNAS